MKTLLAAAIFATFSVSISAEDKPLPIPVTPLAKGVREISVDEAEALIKADAKSQILDVRMFEEFQSEGHLKGAKNVDVLNTDTFDKGVLGLGFDVSKPVIVYCAVGGRAKRAATRMVGLGFKEVLIPKGCFNAWKAAGKPIEK